MQINEQTIFAYKEMLADPEKHNLPFQSLREIFLPSDIAIAKHIVYNEYQKVIDRNIPKLIFYIIMDEIYPQKIAENGDLGYCLEFKKAS